jgi:hypothetical protein
MDLTRRHHPGERVDSRISNSSFNFEVTDLNDLSHIAVFIWDGHGYRWKADLVDALEVWALCGLAGPVMTLVLILMTLTAPAAPASRVSPSVGMTIPRMHSSREPSMTMPRRPSGLGGLQTMTPSAPLSALVLSFSRLGLSF